MPARSIAIVVPDLKVSGGVGTVARFLLRIIADSGEFTASVISIATSRTDRASVRLLDPSTWLRGTRALRESWRGRPCVHVGCRFSEVEAQRYRARRILSEILARHDLVQIVCGTPAWALAAKDCGRPVCLQTASLAQVERRSMLSAGRGVGAILRRETTRLTSWLDHRALRHVSAAFVENHWMQEHLSRHMPARNVHLAPPGVDTEYFRPSAASSGGYVLAVGRLSDPRKNVRLLFSAYSRLRGPEIPNLVLVGSSPSRADLAYAESLGIFPRLRLCSGISGRQLLELYRNASFLALSSDEEGFGMVILEAMASGLPVVSTRCGGPEMLIQHGENGFLTPVGDADALASRMAEMAGSATLRRAMGQQARSIAETRFSLRVTAAPFLQRYATLAP